MTNEIDNSEMEMNFEKMIQSLHDQHEQMLQHSQAYYGITTDDPNSAVYISETLEKYGQHVDPNNNKAILDAIQNVCYK